MMKKKILEKASKSKKDLEFLKDFISKPEYSISEYNEEELEDSKLLKAMKNEKEGDYVPEKDIRTTLKRK